jgi:signal transduction histidine kinase
LEIIRAAWAACLLLQLILWAVALPAYYLRLLTPPPPVEATLAQLGLSAGFYAAYLTAVLGIFAVGCFAIAGVVAWRKSHDVMGLLVSLLLMTMGAANAPNADALKQLHPSLALPVEFSVFLLLSSLILVLFLFPDGRFVPHRAWAPVGLWIAVALGALLQAGLRRVEPPEWFFMVILGGFGAGVAAQIYRYRRVSSHLQRQQTKWVVFGLVSAVAGQFVFGFLAAIFPAWLSPPGFQSTPYDLVSVTGVTFAYFLIPLSIGIAVLWYRLWDIDIIINRALVYGALTAATVGLYALVVAGLGALLQGRGAPLLSLLGAGTVAVLFAPLRDRLQRGVNRLMYGERGDPYGVLARLGRQLEGALAPDAVLSTVAHTLKDALKLPYVAVALAEGDGFTITAAAGAPVAGPIALPLVHRGELVGQLLLGPRSGERGLSALDRRLLDDLARQAGVAAQAVRLTAELRSSNEALRSARGRLVTAREEERRRMRRDLHDGLGPQLAGFTLRLDAARNLLRRDPAAADALLSDLSARAQSAVDDIRRLVYALRPPALDDLGLVDALRQHAAQYAPVGLCVTVEAPVALPPLPAAVEVAAYRIAQEALANVVRHSGAARCLVRVTLEKGLCVEIADDGRGITEGRRAGIGLASMRERAEELDGSCVVASTPGSGTNVRVRLPLDGAQTVAAVEEG